jgi:CHAP domain
MVAVPCTQVLLFVEAWGTIMSHAEALSLFIRAELGKPNVGTNDVNRGQCTGLVAVWLQASSKPLIYADGKYMLTAADPAAYHVEINTPINYPHPGDVIAWNGSMGGGHGHTAIVVAANVNWVAVFEQNNPENSPPIVATHDYSSVLGWLSWA